MVSCFTVYKACYFNSLPTLDQLILAIVLWLRQRVANSEFHIHIPASLYTCSSNDDAMHSDSCWEQCDSKESVRSPHNTIDQVA